MALGKQCPIEREVMKEGAIVSIGEVGGLHHRDERVAAWEQTTDALMARDRSPPVADDPVRMDT